MKFALRDTPHPKTTKWVAFPERRRKKEVDSVYVEARTKEGARKTAYAALRLFGIQKRQVINMDIIRMCKED